MIHREDREALSAGIGMISVESIAVLLIGIVLGGICMALALVWQKIWDRSA